MLFAVNVQFQFEHERRNPSTLWLHEVKYPVATTAIRRFGFESFPVCLSLMLQRCSGDVTKRTERSL